MKWMGSGASGVRCPGRTWRSGCGESDSSLRPGKRRPITDFDFIGFTLQYELSYSNVLNMLELAGIPLYAKDRKGLGQIVVAGGPCACNCEPLADFLDLVFLGEGKRWIKKPSRFTGNTSGREKPGRNISSRPPRSRGCMCPLYQVAYHEDGTVKAVTPTRGAPARVKKAYHNGPG